MNILKKKLLHNLILIPAFNEEKNLKYVLKKCRKYGQTLVIDDGSSDNTYKIAKEISNYVLRNKKNMGYDYSLKKGIQFAFKKKIKNLITFDADGQHNEKYINKFLKLSNNNDIIIGNRNFYNRKIEKNISELSKKIFNINDPLSGFKYYKLKKIKPHWKKIDFKTNHYGMFSLLLAKKVKITNSKIYVKKKNKVSSMGHSNIISKKFLNSFIMIIQESLEKKI